MAKRFKMDESTLELSMGMSSDFEEAVSLKRFALT